MRTLAVGEQGDDVRKILHAQLSPARQPGSKTGSKRLRSASLKHAESIRD
jgi:hypothetical protein